jgi:tRNA-splicing ligase RtcB
MPLAFGPASHEAGRAVSRHQALKQWRGTEIIHGLASRGVLISNRSMPRVVEETPGTYKDGIAVVEASG